MSSSQNGIFTCDECREAWKKVAIDTRVVLGEVLEMLGELSGAMAGIAAHPKCPPLLARKCAEYDQRARDLVDRLYVDTPGAIEDELRAIDATAQKEA